MTGASHSLASLAQHLGIKAKLSVEHHGGKITRRYLDYAGKMFDRVTAGLAIEPAEADAAVIAREIQDTVPETLNERRLFAHGLVTRPGTSQ